jgi:ABC-type transport system substrate-binding protein
MKEAGMEDYEHELISIDDDWRKNTTDAVAAQLRDAGIKVKRTILPGSTFWNDWAKYPSALLTGTTVHSRHRFGVLRIVQVKHGTNLVGQIQNSTRY